MFKQHSGLLQAELLGPVGITVVTDPAAAAQLFAEGRGARLHTHPTADLPADVSHEHELWLKIDATFDEAALQRQNEALTAEAQAVPVSDPTPAGLTAKLIIYDTIVTICSALNQLSNPDFISAKLLAYLNSNGKAGLVGHVRCKRKGCDVVMPHIALGRCLLCDACWGELRKKMLPCGVQPSDSDTAVLRKLLAKSEQLASVYPGMEAFVEEFTDSGQANLLTLANNLPCRANPNCQGACWVTLVSQVIPSIAVHEHLEVESKLLHIAGRVEYWVTDANPTSQYDERLAHDGLKSDFSCTAIACVAALQTCGANAAEKMSNLTDSARKTWADSIKCGGHVHQGMARTQNLATGVRESLPAVALHLGLPQGELNSDDCTFDFQLSLDTSANTDFYAIAFDDTQTQRAKMDFLRLTEQSPPLTYVGREGLGKFLELCLTNPGCEGGDGALDQRLVSTRPHARTRTRTRARARAHAHTPKLGGAR